MLKVCLRFSPATRAAEERQREREREREREGEERKRYFVRERRNYWNRDGKRGREREGGERKRWYRERKRETADVIEREREKEWVRERFKRDTEWVGIEARIVKQRQILCHRTKKVWIMESFFLLLLLIYIGCVLCCKKGSLLFGNSDSVEGKFTQFPRSLGRLNTSLDFHFLSSECLYLRRVNVLSKGYKLWMMVVTKNHLQVCRHMMAALKIWSCFRTGLLSKRWQ